MGKDTLGVNLSKDAMGEALVTALQKLAELQKKHDALRATQEELLEALKDVVPTADILLAPPPGSDLNRRFAAARALIIRVEAG